MVVGDCRKRSFDFFDEVSRVARLLDVVGVLGDGDNLVRISGVGGYGCVVTKVFRLKLEFRWWKGSYAG